MNQALSHLKADPKLYRIIKKVPLVIPKQESNVYEVLLRTVVEQQLSVKAARSIWQRVKVQLNHDLSPTQILEADKELLRGCGLSYPKVNYFKNVAKFAHEGQLHDKNLHALDDAALIKHLSTIKGVGKWSAEMILMFSLGRQNVFPIDDLVIRNAMIKLYGLTSEKRALFNELEEIASHWAPYRSYACYLLWDWYEGNIEID